MTFSIDFNEIINTFPTLLTTAAGIASIASGSGFALRALQVIHKDNRFRTSYKRRDGVSEEDYERDMLVRNIESLTIRQNLLNYVIVSLIFITFGITIVSISYTHVPETETNYFGIIAFISGIIAAGFSLVSEHRRNRQKETELELQIRMIDKQIQALLDKKGKEQ